MDYDKLLIIDEDNFRDHCGIEQDDGSIILPHDNPFNGGEQRFMGCLPRASKPGSLTFAAPANFDLIAQNEWQSRAKDLDDAKATLRHISDAANDGNGIDCLDQNGTNYCWTNSPTGAAMVLRAKQGESYVKLSPASVAGPITGYRNQGGMIESALRYFVEDGVAPASYVPPNSLSHRDWQPGAAEVAKKFRITHWWDMMSKSAGIDAKCATLLLQGIPVCVAYNWWSHAVTLYALIFKDGKFYYLFRNSWGKSYGENGYALLPLFGKGTPDEAYAPRQMVAAA